MTLRKITIDNSVRYIPKSEQTKKIKQNTIKNKKKFNLFQEAVNQTRENKTKNYHKTIKNGLLVDLEYLQNSMYMYKNIYINIRM